MEIIYAIMALIFVGVEIAIFLSPIIIVFLVIKKISTNRVKLDLNKKFFKNNVVASNDKKQKYEDVNKNDLLNAFNTTEIENFKEKLYKVFLDFENAYNKADYNTIKVLTTNQLFQNYYTGISLDLKYGKRKVIKDIEKVNVKLYEVFSSTAKQVASMMIEISYLNYTIDKNNNVINGDKNKKITEKFEVVFRKEYQIEKIKNCPNCGAVLNGNKCDFCNTPIENSEFKISSIKKIIY